jgi:hypothetical protein
MSRLITRVELRGLEPLTFSLRRLGVDLPRREYRVIDVHLLRQKCLGRIPGAHMGHTVNTYFFRCSCRVARR